MRLSLAMVVGFLLAVGSVIAQAAGTFNPAKDVSVTFRKGAVVVQVPAGVHLKAAFMAVTKPEGTPGTLKVGPLPPTKDKDELDDPIWHGKVVIPVAGSGLRGEVPLTVTYQPCVEGEGGVCFAPADRVLKVQAADIPSADAKAAPAAEAKPAPAPEASPAPEAKPAPAAEAAAPAPAPAPASQGLLLVFLGVFGAGLLASLTPCVYPMIPITMAIIGAKGGGKLKGFTLSLTLVLGMAVTYTTLGVVAARTGAAFGKFGQHPAFLIPVSVLFALFALSLFGAFEIRLPDALQQKLQGGGPRRGYGGAFIMGLVLGPLSAPCVGPVIGTVLIAIGQKGDVVLGATQLFTFALGMGVLFIAAGTFTAALPRSGDWLVRLKRAMGLVVLGFAAWNIRLIVPDWASFAMWSLVAFMGAAVLEAFGPGGDLLRSLCKAVGLACVAVGALLGIRALETNLHVDLLPRAGAAAAPAPSAWLSQDLEAALAKAKAEHKLVLVDTYAEWCAQCKELDENTWPDPEVTAWIREHAIAVRIDTDKVRKDLAPKLAIGSYPTVLVLDAEGRELRRSLGYQKPAAMLKFLKG